MEIDLTPWHHQVSEENVVDSTVVAILQTVSKNALSK